MEPWLWWALGIAVLILLLIRVLPYPYGYAKMPGSKIESKASVLQLNQALFSGTGGIELLLFLATPDARTGARPTLVVQIPKSEDDVEINGRDGSSLGDRRHRGWATIASICACPTQPEQLSLFQQEWLWQCLRGLIACQLVSTQPLPMLDGRLRLLARINEQGLALVEARTR